MLTVLLTNLITLLLTLAAQATLARILGTEGRGAYAVLLLFGTSIGVLFTAGIDRASQYHAISQAMPMWNAISSALIVLSIGSIAAICATWPLMHSDFKYFQHATPSQFKAALPLIPASMLLTLFQLHVAGKRSFSMLARASLIQGLLNLLLLFTVVPLADDRTLAALWVYTLSSAAATAILVLHLAKLESIQLAPSFTDLLNVTRYGAKYYVARIGNLIDLGLGTILLSMVADSASVGIFAATSALMIKVLIIADSAEAALLPRIAQDRQQSLDLTCRTFRLCTYVTLVVVCALCAASPILIPAMFSNEFSAGSGIIFAMAPGLTVQAGAGVLMAYFRGTNRPSTCSTAVWLSLCMNVAAFYVLYPAYGMYAAGIAMSAGFFTRAITLVAQFRQTTSVSLRTLLFPSRSDIAYFFDVLSTTLYRAASRKRP